MGWVYFWELWYYSLECTRHSLPCLWKHAWFCSGSLVRCLLMRKWCVPSLVSPSWQNCSVGVNSWGAFKRKTPFATISFKKRGWAYFQGWAYQCSYVNHVFGCNVKSKIRVLFICRIRIERRTKRKIAIVIKIGRKIVRTGTKIGSVVERMKKRIGKGRRGGEIRSDSERRGAAAPRILAPVSVVWW